MRQVGGKFGGLSGSHSGGRGGSGGSQYESGRSCRGSVWGLIGHHRPGRQMQSADWRASAADTNIL